MAERLDAPSDPKRKDFLSNLTNVAMFAGLVTAYGTLAAIMGRFLYPARPSPRGWMFVSDIASLQRRHVVFLPHAVGRSGEHHATRRRHGRRKLRRALERLPTSRMPSALGGRKRALLLPVPQRRLFPRGYCDRGAPGRRWASAHRISAQDRGGPPVHRSRVDGGSHWPRAPRADPRPSGSRSRPLSLRSEKRLTSLVSWIQDRLPVSPGALRELTNEPVPNHLKGTVKLSW